MKINAELIVELRTNKSWSQGELATAAGLNLRTIQRIENEATASLQSRKALASALEVDTLDLEFKAASKVTKYEYKTLEIEKQKLPALAQIFNDEGQQGWRLIQILTPDLAQGDWSEKTGSLLAIMQREILA